MPRGDVSAVKESISNHLQHVNPTSKVFIVAADLLEKANNLQGALDILNLGLKYLPENEV